MISAYEYVEKEFSEEDEITKTKIRIGFMAGAIAKAEEITALVRAENLELQEPDYGSIKEQFEDDEIGRVD